MDSMAEMDKEMYHQTSNLLKDVYFCLLVGLWTRGS